MKPHRNLDVWKRSIKFVVHVYKVTEKFPSSEQYGITSQMRRAAVSIPANIAEGAARRSTRDGLQFFYVSRGSISELDTHIEICKELGLIKEKEYQDLCVALEEIRKMLNGLISYRRT